MINIELRIRSNGRSGTVKVVGHINFVDFEKIFFAVPSLLFLSTPPNNLYNHVFIGSFLVIE